MGLLIPKTYVESIFEITPDWMRAHSLKALLLDLDDTLSPHGITVPGDDILAWVALMKDEGIPMIVLSNNDKDRVAPFCDAIGVPYICDAAKPFPGSYRRAAEMLGLPLSHVAMLGDQILTDMIGANLAGVFAVLVMEREASLNGGTRFKRILELPIKRKLRRNEK
jgi:HAD superfamily phosphatase (TIGR01668 family)